MRCAAPSPMATGPVTSCSRVARAWERARWAMRSPRACIDERLWLCLPARSLQRGIHRDLRLEQLGHRTSGLRLVRDLLELRIGCAGNLRAHGQVNLGDLEAF